MKTSWLMELYFELLLKSAADVATLTAFGSEAVVVAGNFEN